MFMGDLLNQSFPKCVFSLYHYGNPHDHVSCKALSRFVDQTTRWLLEKQSKNRACRGKIDGVFKDQYRVIAKLEYGGIPLSGLPGGKAVHFTQNSLKRINATSLEWVLRVLEDDIFEIDRASPSGRHYCIASKAQGESVRVLQEKFPYVVLPKLLVKSIIRRMWFSVNWFHSTCGVIHTDISPQNVLMQLEDNSSLRDIEDQESRNPSIPTITTDGAAPVNRSRETQLELSGHSALADFGQMRLAEGQTNQDWWKPDL